MPVFSGGSVSDEYRGLVFDVGSDVSNAEVSLRGHEALSQQLEMLRQIVADDSGACLSEFQLLVGIPFLVRVARDDGKAKVRFAHRGGGAVCGSISWLSDPEGSRQGWPAGVSST